MPGAPDRVADEQSFAERPAVVRAGRPQREQLVAAPYEQYRLAPGMPQQRPVRRQHVLGDTGGQIWTRELRFVSTHVVAHG